MIDEGTFQEYLWSGRVSQMYYSLTSFKLLKLD